MQNKFKVSDNSGDRKYFTIIPNFIANHSTANDQSLYFQMKRLAGEGGLCYATIAYFTEKMGIGKRAYKRSLQYLLDHNWVSYVGKEPVPTSGGIQQIDAYKINDIWKINNDFYLRGGAESDTPLELKGGAEKHKGGCQKAPKGGAESAPKEEPLSKNIKKNNVCSQLKDWNEQQGSPISDFKPENIVNKYGVGKIEALIKEYGQENHGFSRFLANLKEN